MRYLIIQQKIVRTFQELCDCCSNSQATNPDSPLFKELIDKQVNNKIAPFLHDIGEKSISEAVEKIVAGDSDIETMKQLLFILLNENVDIAFDDRPYIDVIKTEIKDNKAIFKIKVKKTTVETITISIKHGSNEASKEVNLNRLGEATCSLLIQMTYSDRVVFSINDRQVAVKEVESLLGKVRTYKEVSHFSEGRVRCLDQEGWLFLTPGYQFVNHYDEAHDFSEKRAAVKKNGKWGFIDYDEELVIPCIYTKVGDFSEGLAYFEKESENENKLTIERGFINYEGELSISLTKNYSGFGLNFDNKFNHGLFKIYSRVHVEWINHEGVIVNKYQGERYRGLSEYGLVEFGDIVNGVAKGKITNSHVVHYSPQNEEEEQMSSDFFGAFTVYTTTYLRFDVKKNVIEECNEKDYYETNNDGSPFMNIENEIMKRYEESYPFVSSKWYDAIYYRAGVKRNGLWGFVDELGEEIIPCVFQQVHSYSEGYAAVCIDDGWLFIDVNGIMLK